MKPELWGLLPLAGLCALYGITECCAMTALGYSDKCAAWRCAARRWVWVFLPSAALTGLWSAVGFPLPLFYALIYLGWAVRYLRGGSDKTKNHFLLNLNFINSLTLHLLFIGAAALARGATMHALLSDPFWRTAGIFCVVLVNTIENTLFVWEKRIYSAIGIISQSPEARPFMAFLRFSSGYLLVDSLLCVADREPFYTPLFLIGSNVFLIFFQIRFLLHIGALIRSNHLRNEHDALAAELRERESSVGTLRHLADWDALTGVASRRSVMERLDHLLQSGKPFSLVYLDLDRLKQVNDREGHDAGDRYLIRFAAQLGSHLRSWDLLARVGGDEFVILMPGCGEEAARRRIGSIRDAIMQTDSTGQNIRFSFSYGVTGVASGCKKSAETLLNEADRAMYQDKSRRH